MSRRIVLARRGGFQSIREMHPGKLSVESWRGVPGLRTPGRVRHSGLVSLVLACFQGAVLAVVVLRLVGEVDLGQIVAGALAFPVGAMVLSYALPRVAATAGLLLAVFWAGTCGYMAYEDPSLDSVLWIPVLALTGLLFGAAANGFFFVNARAFTEDNDTSNPTAGRAQRARAPSPPPSRDAPGPWAVLGVDPTASRDELARAYRERIAENHPDKVATMGPEIRALAEERTKAITEAYSRVCGRTR